jgi:hypothetical protein
MALEQDLLQLEKGFWLQGADYYRAHVDGDCLLAFTEMTGIHSNEEIAAMNPGAGAWRAAELDPKGCISLGDDAAVITYEVSAARSAGEPYRAVVSSGYVRRGEEWKMAFHQQTPLEADD